MAQIPECKLSVPELREQHARYRRVAQWVEELHREGGAVVARLSPQADRDLVRATVAIERECCPFFEIAYDADAGVLRYGVGVPDHEPALEAIEYALRA
jgi:hypothetical protein